MWLALEYYKQRMSICNICTDLVDEKCNHCGCYMKYKAVLPHSECPLNKWNKFPKFTIDKPTWFNDIK